MYVDTEAYRETYIYKLLKVKVKALPPDLKAILHKTLYMGLSLRPPVSSVLPADS